MALCHIDSSSPLTSLFPIDRIINRLFPVNIQKLLSPTSRKLLIKSALILKKRIWGTLKKQDLRSLIFSLIMEKNVRMKTERGTIKEFQSWKEANKFNTLQSSTHLYMSRYRSTCRLFRYNQKETYSKTKFKMDTFLRKYKVHSRGISLRRALQYSPTRALALLEQVAQITEASRSLPRRLFSPTLDPAALP